MPIADKLLEVLEEIDRPSDFCVSGSLPGIMLGLEVKGLGPLALPVQPAQISQLKKVCTQAPHGQGQKTVVDTKVRNVWKLPPAKFKIKNPAWKTCLDAIVLDVQEKLGLEGQKLEAELHDLLLYEKGCFFLPHRDSEKHQRMVATLVVVLPCTYTGGALHVRHDGQEKVVDFSKSSADFDIHYAAFYADCEHEVKPLASGHRLCLVYNLILTKAKKHITAPRTQDQISELSNVLHRWRSDKNAPDKLVLLLDHQYTEKGLSWSTLKGADRAKAQALADAAKLENFHLYLALLTLHESGSAEGDYDYSWGRSYRNSDDAEDYEMGEIYETSLVAEHWHAPSGEKVAIGSMNIEENEIIPEDTLREITPESEFEGYTGNAGMTLDRWYRHGAIILWPDERHEKFLCSNGSMAAVPFFLELLKQALATPDDESNMQRCKRLARTILDQWPEVKYAGWHIHRENPLAGKLLSGLVSLGDMSLVKRFFKQVMHRDRSAYAETGIAKAIKTYGWESIHHEIEKLFQNIEEDLLSNRVVLFRVLTKVFSKTSKKERELARKICRQCAIQWLTTMQAADRKKLEDKLWGMDYQNLQRERMPWLIRLCRGLLTMQDDDLLTSCMMYLQSEPRLYSTPKLQVPLLISLTTFVDEKLKHQSSALLEWISTCRSTLDELTAEEPQVPSDFARDVKVRCNCKDCQVLIAFLKSRTEAVHRFPAAEYRRRHLEEVFGHKDLAFTTERKGSPHTLVCTKTQAGYQRQLKTYHENLEHLATMRKLEAKYSST